MTDSFYVPEPSENLLRRAESVRRAALLLAQETKDQRAKALRAMADALALRAQDIVFANQEDLKRSANEGLSKALMSRLKLDEVKLEGAIQGVRKNIYRGH